MRSRKQDNMRGRKQANELDRKASKQLRLVKLEMISQFLE